MGDTRREKVLQSLASIDPIQLCNEARTSEGGGLYAQCVAAGLISRDGAAVGRGYGAEEAARLHALFDVALENGLAALVSHYVTEVCMDTSVVSSDAIETKLLDGSIVQSWAERTLRTLFQELRDIYADHSEKQNADLSGVAGRLRGLSHVLDALLASIADGASPAQQRLQDLKEALLKAIQHVEVFSWCSQQRWLERLRPHHATPAIWAAAFQRRKDAAAARHWPIGAEPTTPGTQTTLETDLEGQQTPVEETPHEAGTLFVEDALEHLGLGESDKEERSEPALWLDSLAQEGARSPESSGRTGMEIEGREGGQLYPPSRVRGAVDLLFLRGWASEFLAKKAIFLYYLYDRFWGRPAEEWQAVVCDYCTAFHLPDFFRIECLLFFLLDNDALEALQEACQLLPQIAGPKLHPRIPQVLLERGAPQEALTALRASGRLLSPSPAPLPLEEAVTALRAALACGPLSEAYLFQHNHWAALRESLAVHASIAQPAEPLEDSDEERDLGEELAVLVTELVNFSARGGVLRAMVELPWAPEEEGPMETALIQCAERDPGGAAGSHLVVYYLLRCRYAEAMIRHRDVSRLEDAWEGGDEAKRRRAALARQQRTNIVEACYQLLPEAERRLLEHQLAHPEPPPPSMDVDRAPAFPPALPAISAAPQSPIFPQLPARQARLANVPPGRPMTSSLLRPQTAPNGPSALGKEANGRSENGAEEGPVDEPTEKWTADGDAEYSPRPRKLLYDEVGGAGAAAEQGGANTPGAEEDGLQFYSPLGRFTPDANGPAENGDEAGGYGYRIGASNGPVNGAEKAGAFGNASGRSGEGLFAKWGMADGPGLAAGGPFTSPISAGAGLKRGRQPTPAPKKVASFRANGDLAEGEEDGNGTEDKLADGLGVRSTGQDYGNEEGAWAGGGLGPPPRGTLSDDVDMTENIPASPSFQLPKPPTMTNAGHTPAFSRNGGRARWRAEEDLEDTLLDEAVASALTPGIKRPKAGTSERSKKILRKGVRLL
ncbi:hypothetical protein KFL_001250210 [Klebsormidium nitens]|uniref:ELYS-like domain-containing protein n=1 Tax=Klebsormidium nitens TaxID=105231 RepID=A0A1Y1HW23_KLENI|nr:hypothetical protein KFL_001250210 [Klebsormidium nitens]|eukprot:GAQ82825.1 hypothetical protein KFL_001250210 [Klebsormidium nitens]